MSYKDQSDVFYESPHAYLLRYFPPVVNHTFPPSRLPRTMAGQIGDVEWEHEWPLYLVMYGSLVESRGVKDLILDRGYINVWEGGSGLGEERRQGKMIIWKYRNFI
jgi:GPI mannosyltransferase 3